MYMIALYWHHAHSDGSGCGVHFLRTHSRPQKRHSQDWQLASSASGEPRGSYEEIPQKVVAQETPVSDKAIW